MVYDTLFALDGKLDRPAADGRPLRDQRRQADLDLHAARRPRMARRPPVTAEDCVASIKRWGARDAMGQKLMSYVAELAAPDAKTIRMTLKEPYGLVLQTLAKPGANVPFMMPKRVAETDPQQADHRLRRLRPFHLQARRMAAGREGRLPQEPEIQAAHRAGLRARRRQGRQGRPGRVDLDRGRADPGQRAAQGRGRHHRGAAARPPAVARRGQEHRAVRLESGRPAIRLPLQRAAQAVRQPEGPPGGRLRAQPEGLLDP